MSAKHYTIEESITGLQMSMALRELLEKVWLLPKKYVHFLRIRENVTVNGSYQTMNSIVNNHDVVRMHFLGDEFRTPTSNYQIDDRLELPVIFENRDLMVVNKPAGIKSHPNQADERGTLMNFAAAYLAQTDEAPFMVHRIDQQTSGAVIIAKNPVVVPILDRLISSHLIKRSYLAIVDGQVEPKTGLINGAIGTDPMGVRKRKINGENAQTAVTHYHVLAANKLHSLVRLDLETGRTHQIRVHLASIGHPIVGDPLYNNQPQSGEMLLHGFELQLVVPFKNTQQKINVKYPDYFYRDIVHYSLN